MTVEELADWCREHACDLAVELVPGDRLRDEDGVQTILDWEFVVRIESLATRAEVVAVSADPATACEVARSMMEQQTLWQEWYGPRPGRRTEDDDDATDHDDRKPARGQDRPGMLSRLRRVGRGG